MESVKVINVGNAVGIILPRDLLTKLRVEKGDTLYVTETTNGIQLSPYRPDVVVQLDAAEIIMHENHDVLKKLAE